MKRLEEALYHGAASKVGSETNNACCFARKLLTTTCVSQEEYVNTSSLEQRLQNVARTFVSQRPRQQQSQPPHSRPGSAGLAQQMPYLNNGFSTGNPQAPFTQANFSAMMASAVPHRPGSAGPAQSSQQQHSAHLPGGQTQNAQMQSGPRLGMSQASPVLANQPGPANSMPMASQSMNPAQSPAQSRDQPNLASPHLATADSNLGHMAPAPQQQAALLRSQQAPAADGPLMSNGKPALLRGPAARDGVGWAQGPTMVSQCNSCCLLLSMTNKYSEAPVCFCSPCQTLSQTTGCSFRMVGHAYSGYCF